MRGLQLFLMAAAQILLVGQAPQLFVFQHAFQFGHARLQLFMAEFGSLLLGGFDSFGILVLFGHGFAFFERIGEFHMHAYIKVGCCGFKRWKTK